MGMCFHDLLLRLKEAGIEVSEPRIRWAIRRGHVSRPPRDGSLRFNFSDQNVSELVAYFQSRGREAAPAA